MKLYTALLLFLLSAVSLQAQYSDSVSEETTDDETLSRPEPIDPRMVSRKTGYETEKIDLRRFDKKKWEEVIRHEDYSEEPRVKKQKESSMGSGSNSGKRPQRDDQSDERESSTPISSPILQVIFYLIAFGILGFILFFIIKNSSFKSNKKIPKPTLADETTHIHDIRELEVDRLLVEAVSAGNYRLAIRIHFLGLLKKLDEEKLIVWKKNKTNFDYLSELFSQSSYFEEVKTLTLAYEQVWYGDHSFPQKAYEETMLSFQTLDQKLNAAKVR